MRSQSDSRDNLFPFTSPRFNVRSSASRHTNARVAGSLVQQALSKRAQHKGIGKALLLASLWGLREMGYVYGIIGAAGPVDFYQKTVGAIIIPDSEPGIYVDLLKQ